MADFTFWEVWVSLYPAAYFIPIFALAIRSSQPLSSFTCPSSPFILFFHIMSIPMSKGHPGNREAAVDREINKQKKRERCDGGQSLVIQRVNYRRASYKDTPNISPLLRIFFSFYILFSVLCYLYTSIPVLCSAFLSVLPLSLGTKITHAVVIVEIFLDRSATLYLLVLAISACFHLGRTWVIIAESSRPTEALWLLNRTHLGGGKK